MNVTDKFRVGIDIGGTFTDVVFVGTTGRVYTKKIASTPDNYNRGIVRALEEVFHDTGLTSSDIAEVVHGCTVATNAILEHAGALTGLITTKGFRDVLEIRRIRMPELYNIYWNKPAPLSPRELRLEVDERIDYLGEIIRPLDTKEVERVIDELVTKGVESVAVCLLNSYANPIHEHKIKEMTKEKYPDLFVSISSELIPIIKEYERTSETVVNSYVKPVVARYLDALQNTLRNIGVKAPLLVMQSNGGMMSVEIASEKPMYIIECGPAAGVVGSNILAKSLVTPNLLTLDMGGTTTKASIIENNELTLVPIYEVGSGISTASRLSAGGGYAIRVPTIDIAEIGAGGGSKLWLDVGGVLHVGPRSAGAVPGPVCYDIGGTEATLADAACVLGYLPEELSDNMKLNKPKAFEAIQKQVAEPMKMDVAEAAFGAYTVANSDMIRAIKTVSTLRGRDPRDFALLAYGGAGPIHAAALARELEIERVIVPPWPGVFSSFGLLFAQIEHHLSESFFHRVGESIVDDANAVWAKMRDKVLAEIEAANYGDMGAVDIAKAIDARYVGQGSELTMLVPWEILRVENIPQLIENFHAEHLKTYAHNRADEPVDTVTLRLVAKVSFARGRVTYEGIRMGQGELKATVSKVRKAYFGKEYGWLETPVLRREVMPDEPMKGPLIIEFSDSTCVVPPYAEARPGMWEATEIYIRD